LVSGEKKRFNIKMIPVVIKRGKIPRISNSGKRTSTNHKIAALIKILKRLRVKSLRGKVIFFKTGFIKRFISPKINPQNKKISIGPSNFTPGTNLWANQRPEIAIEI